MQRFTQTLIFTTSLALLLSACGGGGGGKSSSYNPAPGGYDYSSVATTSAMSSSSSSSPDSSVPSTSSAVASSLSSSSSLVATAAPIDRLITNIGSTWIAKDSVNVLGSDLSVKTQAKDQITLYVFDNDAPGQSACTSVTCLTNWPPLLAKASDVAQAPLSIITRADGNKQWALRNKPLYFYSSDTKPGDISGEGVGGVWHVALTQPVLLSKASQNALDGDYLVSSGNVLEGSANSGNTAFTAVRHDLDNFSLYTFDNDTDGVSNCSGACLAAWPPLLADANDKAEMPYSIIDRDMGTAPKAKQWAYQGKPLYFYAGDAQAWQTSGKSISKWHLARPQPQVVKKDAVLADLLVATGLVKSATPVNGVETTTSVARHGFTLYTFDSDTQGTSNCSGTCLSNWPALMANDGAVAQAPYSLITRASGAKQWAINGMPLYFYVGDTAAGDTKGEGVGGKWVVARGAPVAVSSNASKGKFFIAHGALVNASGVSDAAHNNFTLYTYDKDPVGQATCNSGCISVWPALYAASDAVAFGDFTLVVRTTGEKQWAYKGKPLYFYVGDSAAGDVNGVYTDWSLAQP